MEPRDVASSLIDALASEGELEDEGVFTLDSAKAREKLRAYQLVDAHEWVLLAIEAGHLATGGLGPVHVSTGRSASVRFSQLSFTAEQLEHCFASVFGREREGSVDERVLRLLALAGNAALSLGSTQLELRSVGPGGELDILRVDADDNQSLGREPGSEEVVGVRIGVEGGRGVRDPGREEELVRERGRFSTAGIYLDDERISGGTNAAFEQTEQRVEIRVDGVVVGEAGFERHGTEAAKAFIVNRSVLVETLVLDDCLATFVAVVHVDLPMDLSHRQIVRDARWDALLTAIRDAHDALPRPRMDLGTLATEGGPRPWRTAAIATGSVLGVGCLIGLVVYLVTPDPQPSARQLLEACGAGDVAACVELAETTDPSKRSAALRAGCRAGEQSLCAQLGALVYASDRERGLKLLADACDAGETDACERITTLAGTHELGLDVEITLCRHAVGDAATIHCEAWIDSVRPACERELVCTPLRQALTQVCAVEAGPRCLEAAWMQHLGYGGPRDPTAARRLFDAACKAGDEVGCEWSERAPVDERSCLGGDAWACYALGFEAYATSVSFDATALGYFQRACEGGLATGCHVVGLAYLSTDIGRDLDVADQWFARACDAGTKLGCDAREIVARLRTAPEDEWAEFDGVGPLLALPSSG